MVLVALVIDLIYQYKAHIVLVGHRAEKCASGDRQDHHQQEKIRQLVMASCPLLPTLSNLHTLLLLFRVRFRLSDSNEESAARLAPARCRGHRTLPRQPNPSLLSSQLGICTHMAVRFITTSNPAPSAIPSAHQNRHEPGDSSGVSSTDHGGHET